MSNREAGGSSALAGYRNVLHPVHVADLERLWNLPPGRLPRRGTLPITSDEALQPGIDSLVRRVREGRLRVLWVAATNPAVTLPDLERLYADLSLQRGERPFVVVQDLYDPVETLHFADLFLPAAQWGEKTGTYTCSERRVNLGRRAVAPPGADLAPLAGARPDLDIIRAVADELARRDPRFADAQGRSVIAYETAEECFEEWRRVSAGTPCDMSGMSHAALAQRPGIAWPCRPSVPEGTQRLYADGVFPTSWGRAQYGAPDAPWIDPEGRGRAYLWAVDQTPLPEVPDADYPFWLITGRVIEHFHSRTKTKRVRALHGMVPESSCEVHPADAARLGVATGDLVRVRSRRGAVIVRAQVTETVSPGAVFLPMHFGDLDPDDVRQNQGRLVNANRLTLNWVDPTCKQPIYKHCAVALARA